MSLSTYPRDHLNKPIPPPVHSPGLPRTHVCIVSVAQACHHLGYGGESVHGHRPSQPKSEEAQLLQGGEAEDSPRQGGRGAGLCVCQGVRPEQAYRL